MGRTAAVVLAAGRGRRMNSDVAKQYMLIGDKPILYYTISAFENSDVDEIIVVSDDACYCRKEIVEHYGFLKVTKVINGGKERYDSVYQALYSLEDVEKVLIHDGARPCIQTDIINKSIDELNKKEAIVVAVPVKDTIKVVIDQKIDHTPNRELLWNIQTPQCFSYSIIKEAYDKLQCSNKDHITDDAMVLEEMLGMKAAVMMGSYENIKVTTPEDIRVAKLFLNV